MGKRGTLTLCTVSLLVWPLFAGMAGAIEMMQKEATCPACSNTQPVIVAFFGHRDQCLDGEPRWIEGKPGAWANNLCNTCRCPLLSDKYGAQLAKLLQGDAKIKARDYLGSKEYREAAKEAQSYFLLAKLFEKLGGEPADIGDLYLHSTWQDPDDARDEKAWKLSLACYKDHLGRPGRPDERIACLAGELERRLGDFDAARRRFQQLRAARPKDENLRIVIAYELHLIAEKDRGQYLLSSAKEWWAKDQKTRNTDETSYPPADKPKAGRAQEDKRPELGR